LGAAQAGDLCWAVTREVRRLKDDSGLVFTHSIGKTLRNGKGKVLCITRMPTSSICPVAGLEQYMTKAGDLGIDLSTGYIFRSIDRSRQVVLDDHVSYSAMYDRLKYYLAVLNIDEGETPHSLRGGCAITLALASGCSQNVMDHVGWASEGSFDRYSRARKMACASSVSSVLANVMGEKQNTAEKTFASCGDFDQLPLAFFI
jgi:integrase